jgi:exodeoxyribonuclease VII small subunit
MDRQSSYARTRERLEEIVTQVKAKDMSLERSLDLYEEALRLGNVCAEMIDRTDFSAEELEGVRVADEAGADGEAGEAAAGDDATGDDATGDEAVAGDGSDETDEAVEAAATTEADEVDDAAAEDHV